MPVIDPFPVDRSLVGTEVAITSCSGQCLNLTLSDTVAHCDNNNMLNRIPSNKYQAGFVDLLGILTVMTCV